VVRAGWVACFEPSAVVAHRQWRTRREVLRLEFGYGLGSGAFAVKVARADRRSGGRLLAHRMWGNGIRRSVQELAAGHEHAALVCLVKAAGVIVGASRGYMARLDGPRYRAS
jgi:hypothetical protein